VAHWAHSPYYPRALKAEISRAAAELSHGTAIKRDQAFGRPKYCEDGFYGLEVAKDEVYRLKQTGADVRMLDSARMVVSQLTDKLAGDAESLQAIETWHRHFKERGTTIPEVMDNYMRLETGLRKDFTNGYFELADYVGFDPIAMLQMVIANQQPLGGQAR
jgi:hypothetical protein